MRKRISAILTIFMIFGLVLTGCAAGAETDMKNSGTEIVLQIGNPNMTVNGTEKTIDSEGTAPLIVNERTLLPIRAVIEEIGGEVGWNGETSEVTLTYGNDEIKLEIGSTEAYLNGKKADLDTAPAIIGGRTMLPIRFIAESFKFEVKWDGKTQKITVSNKADSDDSAIASEDKKEASGKKSAVIYFSCTNNTKRLAEKIAAATDSDIFEIVPKQPYTDEDIDYNSDCRANREQNDDLARPEILTVFENLDEYDTVYLGYPIWWGTMPKIINTFLETYDLSGKTVMPFCTSGSSGISTSVKAIKAYLPDVKEGMRGTSSTTEEEIKTWIENSK